MSRDESPYEIRRDLTHEIAEFFLDRIPSVDVPTMISYFEAFDRVGVIEQIRRKRRARARKRA